MILLILSLAFIAAGLIVWIVGARIDRRAVGASNKAQKKKYRHTAAKLGLAARISFILAALCFILGFILLQGAQLQ